MQYKNQIKRYIEKNHKKIGLKKINKIKISLLGIGEANHNYLVTITKQKFNFRLCYRPEMEGHIKQEFKILKNLPKGLGPEPIFCDITKKDVPLEFSILKYIEGKSKKRWTLKDLKHHAKKLAKLHNRRYTECYQGKTFDMHKRLLYEGLKGYGKKIFKEKDIKIIYPIVEKYIKENNGIFKSLKKFSQVHTDLTRQNSLFHKNKIHYIDWEWSTKGDNAWDLAKLYYPDIKLLDWSLKLSKEQEEIFLDTYKKNIKFKDMTLKKRIRLWQTYIKITDLVYFKWKLQNWETEQQTTNRPKKYYQETCNLLVDSLKKEFIKK